MKISISLKKHLKALKFENTVVQMLNFNFIALKKIFFMKNGLALP